MTDIPHLDVRGLACPQPVLKTKALLDGGHKGPLTVELDNEASAVNVAAFLQGQGFTAQTYQQGRQWLVLGREAAGPEILVWHGPRGWQAAADDDQGAPRTPPDESIIDLVTPVAVGAPAPPPAAAESAPAGRSLQRDPDSPRDSANTVLLAGSRFMGLGDETLGAKLAAAFFDTLAALDQPPRLAAFYNGGVYLTTHDSPILEAIKDLAEQGAVVISCGVCLEYFKLKEQLKVGRIGNMYEIINAQRTADRVVRL
ncbi:MAG: sulfurtransferase-like selenium metabolism protein YedF [Candidatus Adiutrix sp.]|jgi:TusA-related sulfurtransferase|nr:sulfurtransferase-like selenium metabolism protein YedF [Candidatus Adiutrix sp.]